MNTKLLLQVKEAILHEPEQFRMYDWFTTDPDNIPNCGTAACICGWACAINLGTNPAEADQMILWPDNAKNNGLELDERQSARLFFFPRWPEQFKLQSQDDAQQAAARIDHFIATNGEE